MYNTLPYVSVYDTMIEWKAAAIIRQNFSLQYIKDAGTRREFEIPELVEVRVVPGKSKTRTIRRKAETLDDLFKAGAQKLYTKYSTPIEVIEQDLREVVRLMTFDYDNCNNT